MADPVDSAVPPDGEDMGGEVWTDCGNCGCQSCQIEQCSDCECDATGCELHDVADGDRVCDECIGNYSMCDDCEDTRPASETACHSVAGRSGDMVLCDNCRENYSRCVACEHLVSDGDTYPAPNGDWTGEIACQWCHAEHVYSCDECGQCYWADDGPLCECGEPDDDDGSLVHGYCYKPSPVFHGEDPNHAFYGVELEMETPGCDRYEAAQIMADGFGSFGYLKSDSSLEGGFECVTHPAAFPEITELYPWGSVARVAEMGARSWQGGRCGVHVHVSRRTFSDAHLGRFLWLFYNAPDEWQSLAGRSSSTWAKFDDQSARMIGKICKKLERPRERYTAVNLTNSQTVEVRIFRGTLNTETLAGYVAGVAAAVEYTRHGSIVAVDRDGFRGLADWVKDRPEYAAFFSLIRRKCNLDNY